MRYFSDVRALARKDLLLELRAKDTLPAMLLFVVATFVVFHFSLPEHSSRLAASGLLWVAILFTALLGLGRAFVPEQEQRVLDGLVLAPCDRSAIWLAKGDRDARVPRRRRGRGAPRVLALLPRPARSDGRRPSCLPTSGSAPSGHFSAPWPWPPAPGTCCCRFSSCRWRFRSWSAASAPASSRIPGKYLAFLGLYDAMFALLCWASFEYVVTE